MKQGPGSAEGWIWLAEGVGEAGAPGEEARAPGETAPAPAWRVEAES
jgi:hypothetical protein